MPKPAELIFALKTFLGAMAAHYLALWLGLADPYWSMATAYIVAQPFTGAMRSKALYRFIGTFMGGTAAIVLVPNLVQAPPLLCIALALWIGLCLYLSLLDRGPRAYVFMLAGYTAGIIGFPSVAAPDLIFQTALTRVEEISLGIACTTVIGGVIMPRPLGPVLAARIAGWVRPGIDWAVEALAGRDDTAIVAAARRHLATEAADVAMMTTQLAFDSSAWQAGTRHILRFRLDVLGLMPVLSSISDRVAQLRALGGLTPELQAVLEETAHWVRAGGPQNAAPIQARITAYAPTLDTWCGFLRAGLKLRLLELVGIMHDARAIRRHVFEGEPAPDDALLRDEYRAAQVQLRDHGMALLSALAAGAAVLLVCAFWILAAWPAGAGAAVIVAVACSFFAAQDDPAPAIMRMLRNAVIVSLAGAVYTFAVFPRVETFAALALVLLPAALLVGVLVSRPATFGTGMVLGAFGATSLALGNGYAGNFAAYANNVLALVLGLAAALTVTRLLRSVGAEWSATRLLRAGWAEIAAAAQATQKPDRARLTGRMMDRLGLMMPRLAAASPGADNAARGMLKDLRVGLNLIALEREFPRMPAAAVAACRIILAELAAYYRRDPRAPVPAALEAAMRSALAELVPVAAAQNEALMLLTGLRSALEPDAPPPELAGLATPERAAA